MRKMRGFTLIELLIVVAIIAILAAIAIPNFLEAQTRAKVSKAKADMRTIATAIESYAVDYSNNPACGVGVRGLNKNIIDEDPNPDIDWAGRDTEADDSPTWYRHTFIDSIGGRTMRDSETIAGITTPVAYIAKLPTEPFSEVDGCNFGYVNCDNKGWILWSTGPDMDLKWADASVIDTAVELRPDRSDNTPHGCDWVEPSAILWGSLDHAFLTTSTRESVSDGVIDYPGAQEWTFVDNPLSGTNRWGAGWTFMDKRDDFVSTTTWQNTAQALEDNTNSNGVGYVTYYLGSFDSSDPYNNDYYIFNPYGDNPTKMLQAMTYDPSNGSISTGEIVHIND